MASSLYSPSWYRVAGLKPRLRSHAQIHRHFYRGQQWYVLQDHSNARYYRFGAAVHDVIGLFDGKHTVQEIWDLLLTRRGDNVPEQDQIIRLLGQLHAGDVLQCDIAPDSLEVFERYQRKRHNVWKQRLLNPMSLRFPLLDPDDFLERYLAFMGADVAKKLAQVVTTDSPAKLRAAVRIARDCGADELSLVPTTLDPEEIDRVADALA